MTLSANLLATLKHLCTPEVNCSLALPCLSVSAPAAQQMDSPASGLEAGSMEARICSCTGGDNTVLTTVVQRHAAACSPGDSPPTFSCEGSHSCNSRASRLAHSIGTAPIHAACGTRARRYASASALVPRPS